MRLPIHLQREIARIHYYDPAQSNRAIARATGASANTVRGMRKPLYKTALTWNQLEALDDDAWRATLGTHDKSIARRKGAPDWEWLHGEMQRDDATLEQLWQEWRAQNPTGIQYSQFTAGYRKRLKAKHIVFRRTHRPGDKLFVDFAGRTVEIRDPQGGPSVMAQIFVAVLGYSNLTYLEAVASQTTADWVKCHVNCFNAMGGAPAWVVSDNLKAAVWRREKDRIVINPAYRDCLKHYDTAPLPTGARKPKHKAKAEVGVQIAQRWVLFALRDRVFFSLDELNKELKQRTAQLNAHPFRKIPGCRQSRFLEGEQSALKELPGKDYELSDWRYNVRAGDDYHVEHDARYYSVPSRYAGERVDYRFTATTIEIFQKSRRLALHALLANSGDVATLPEHRPVAHQRVFDGEPKALIQWAQTVGPHTHQMICHHIQDRNDMTNGLKAARRIRDLARAHGDPRIEEVCAYALPLGITSQRSIISILQRKVDKRERLASASAQPPVGEVRGSTYYAEAV